MAAWTPVTRALRGPVANWAHSRCSINVLTDFCHFSFVTARQPRERECRWVTDGGTETEPQSPKTSRSALPQTPPTLGLTYLASSPHPHPQAGSSPDRVDSVSPGLPASTAPCKSAAPWRGQKHLGNSTLLLLFPQHSVTSLVLFSSWHL